MTKSEFIRHFNERKSFTLRNETYSTFKKSFHKSANIVMIQWKSENEKYCIVTQIIEYSVEYLKMFFNEKLIMMAKSKTNNQRHIRNQNKLSLKKLKNQTRKEQHQRFALFLKYFQMNDDFFMKVIEKEL